MPPVLSATMDSSLWGQAGNRVHGSWPTKAKANRHASRRLKSGRMPFVCWNSRGATSKTSWQFSLQLNSSLGNFKVSLNHTYVQFLCSEELTSFYPDEAILPATESTKSCGNKGVFSSIFITKLQRPIEFNFLQICYLTHFVGRHQVRILVFDNYQCL